MKAYHFTTDKLRDGSPIPPIGEWLEFKGAVSICKSGLHYSKEPFDALQYAPGNLLHLVEVEDVVEKQNDKGVCRRRKILKTIDATELLRKFARDQALSVYHIWGNERTDPNGAVKRYLETGDESLRDAATDAARAAGAARAAWAARAARAAACAATDATYAAADAAACAAGAAARAAAYAAADAARAAWAARKDFNKRVKDAFKGVK